MRGPRVAIALANVTFLLQMAQSIINFSGRKPVLELFSYLICGPFAVNQRRYELGKPAAQRLVAGLPAGADRAPPRADPCLPLRRSGPRSPPAGRSLPRAALPRARPTAVAGSPRHPRRGPPFGPTVFFELALFRVPSLCS